MVIQIKVLSSEKRQRSSELKDQNRGTAVLTQNSALSTQHSVLRLEPPEPVPAPEPPGYTLLYAMPNEEYEPGHWWILWAALWLGISFSLGLQVGLGAPVLDLMLIVVILLVLVIIYAFVLIFSRLVWPDGETNR